MTADPCAGVDCTGFDSQCSAGVCTAGTCSRQSINEGGACTAFGMDGACQTGFCNNTKCPAYLRRDGDVCVSPCASDPCSRCTSGFVQCLGNPDGTYICGTNIASELPSGTCPVDGCDGADDGFTCLSGGSGTFGCYKVLNSVPCFF